MELILLALLGAGAIVATVGATATILLYLISLVLRYVWSEAPRDGRAGWFVPSSRHARLWPWLRKLLKHEVVWAADPASGSASLPKGPVLFACRPHGMLAASACLTVFSGQLDRPGHRPCLLAVHSAIFNVPLMREVALLLGCIDVSRSSIEAALSHGYSVAVLPGGVKEMGAPLLPQATIPGIVKMAHAYNVPLVPVYFAGEQQLCWVWAHEPGVIRWMRRTTYAWIGIFFPLLFMPRFWDMPKTLETRIGRAILPEKETADEAALALLLATRETQLGQQQQQHQASVAAQ